MPAADRPTLPDDAPLPISMLYPGEWWDEDYQEQQDRAEEDIVDGLDGAEVVGVVDSDADGLGCEVVLREAFSDKDVFCFPAGHREPVGVGEAGDFIAEHAPDAEQVVIADLCPNEGEVDEFIEPYAPFEGRLTVLDHHDWSGEMRSKVSEYADLVVEADRCATQLVLDEFIPDAPDHLREFADVTADHDLWIKEDERSNDLSDFSFWAEDRDQYVEACRKHGADIMDDPETREFIESQRAEKEAKIRIAVEGPNSEERAAVRDTFRHLIEERTDGEDSVTDALLDSLVGEDDTGDADLDGDLLNLLVYNDGADWYEVDFDEVEVEVSYDWYVENRDNEPSTDQLVLNVASAPVARDTLGALADGDVASLGEEPADSDTVDVPLGLLDALITDRAPEDARELTRAVARGSVTGFAEDPCPFESATNLSERVRNYVDDGDKRVRVTIEGPLTVALLYGDMYASGAGEAAQQAGADLAVIVPPWNKASLRSTNECPIAASVAKRLNGGGHPPAAGCKPNVAGGDGFIPYDKHWATKGRAAKAVVMEEIVDLTGGTPEEIDAPQ